MEADDSVPAYWLVTPTGSAAGGNSSSSKDLAGYASTAAQCAPVAAVEHAALAGKAPSVDALPLATMTQISSSSSGSSSAHQAAAEVAAAAAGIAAAAGQLAGQWGSDLQISSSGGSTGGSSSLSGLPAADVPLAPVAIEGYMSREASDSAL